MNNRERAQQIADEHGNDAYSVALAMLDNIERSSHLGRRYESLIENGLICSSCGGSGFLGNPPDDYYDCPECARSLNKIEADAVRKAAFALSQLSVDENNWEVDYLMSHANQLEKKYD